MGYTHSWSRPQVISPAAFHAITADFQQVMPALETAGSPIANAHGLEEPEFAPDHIRFNGVRHCGHAPNPEVRLPWPGNGAGGIGSNVGITSGTLSFRTCNGDCSYESVWFDRCIDTEWTDEDGTSSSFCKTAFRPYDLALTVFLLIAKQHLGREFRIKTDGEAAQWEDAQRLCQAELDYSLSFEEVVE